jgi:hypothetical protein
MLIARPAWQPDLTPIDFFVVAGTINDEDNL